MITKPDKIFQEVLIDPIGLGANKLCVLSGYATSAMAFRHMDAISAIGRPVEVELIVGMTPFDGISLTNHRGFQQIVTEDYAGRFRCGYVHPPPAVHSKLYVWLTDDRPLIAFAGSANYTQTAFGRQRELLTQCDPDDAFAYFHQIVPESIYCELNDAELLVQVYNDKELVRRRDVKPASEENEIQQTLAGQEAVIGLPRKFTSFLAKDGSLPQVSGLNWGQGATRKGRTGNEAYIPIRSEIQRTDFFPDVAVQFTVLTDDNKVMIFARGQDDGKGVSTPNNNSEVGLYFRNRLGVGSGDPVYKEHLEAYGRHDVCFYKIDDETYFLDFSNAA